MNILGRKIFHLLSAIFVIPTLILPDPWRKILFILLFLLVLTVDTLRMNNRSFRHIFMLFFKDMLKKEELRLYSGATFLFFSLMIINLFFSREVAAFSLMLLTISDPLASIMGIYMKPRIRIMDNKTLWGLIGFLVGGTIVAMLFNNLSWKSKIIAVVTGAVVELFAMGIDDNLLIPLSSAIALQLTKGGEAI